MTIYILHPLLFTIIYFIFRIFMGKNTVAQIAFGRNPEEEYKDNMRNLSNVSYINAFFCLQ